MSAEKRGDEGLILTGLDGSNPLAFLAALGALRMLASACGDVKMKWISHAGAWRPSVVSGALLAGGADAQRIALDAIESAMCTMITNHPAVVLSGVESAEQYGTTRLFMALVVNSSTIDAREATDWVSATRSGRSDLSPAATSQLQTVRKDYFYNNLRTIIEETTRGHLRRCLFAPWSYADALDNQSLHIDPSEDRRHAYQWHQPTTDRTRSKQGGMLGANRLAIEAFPLFQSVDAAKKLSTVGFTGNKSDSTRWTWPIWSCALGWSELGSVLSLGDLHDDEPERRALQAIGVSAVFRCRRIIVGKTPNLSPALSLF